MKMLTTIIKNTKIKKFKKNSKVEYFRKLGDTNEL